MPTEVLMPALSPTMEEGTLTKWLVSEGQTVKAGDVIAEIETDKATMEVEAVDEGKVTKILVPAGTENVKVNTPIALIEGEDEADPRATAAPQQRYAAPRERESEQTAAIRRAAGAADGAAAGRACAQLRAAIAPARDRARHRDGRPDDARSAARRHGRGDAPRSGRVPHRRGGGAVPGRLQGEPEPAGGIRRAPRHRHADHRAGFCRRRHRRGLRGPEAHRRVHDVELRHAGDRPDHQLGGQDALHVGRRRARCRSYSAARTAPRRASPRSTANATRPGTRTCPA